jgi:pimeloyl-ACP methyl ester carboxylesterase
MNRWSWQPPAGSGATVRLERANGIDFELVEAGQGDRLALCLHGFPELNVSWRHQIPLLAGRGWRVWAPNMRGYGASSRPTGVAAYDIDRLVEDVAALVDASGAREVMLVAHDWGAVVAWVFAARRVRPLSRLVVMNVPHPACMRRELRHWHQLRKSWYAFFFQLPRIPEWALARGGGAPIRRAFVASAANKQRFPSDMLDIYARAALRPGALTAMLNYYRAAFRAGDRIVPTSVIETPTLMIWGDADIALDVRTLDGTDAFVRDLEVHRLPGISHWVQQDAPEAVNAILGDWLDRRR